MKALAAGLLGKPIMSDSETIYLHRISELPFNADAEIFQHYPGFKVGVTRCVNYYARLLLPLVKNLINESAQSGWILTSPALAAQTPAAANLLCWELFDMCTREPNPQMLSVVDIEYDNQATASIDYANLDFAARVTERERLGPQLVRNANFLGRPVLFVNDIRVTGAQQHAMQKYFDDAGAACVKWLYIIVVDPEIGKEDPRIEWQINFAPFEDLLRLVCREEIRFTGKCAHRLMSLSTAELDQILQSLDDERRKQLLELVTRNGFHEIDGFQRQVDLIRSYDQNA